MEQVFGPAVVREVEALDGGVVYWRRGTFLVVVLTWNPGGVGVSSEVLAGRVARAALQRFSRRAGAAGSGTSARLRRG